MAIEVPTPDMPPPGEGEKIDFATEVAFNALLADLKKNGVIPTWLAVMGLMYLQDEAVTRQFQDACKAVVDCLKKSLKEGEQQAEIPQ